MEPDLQILPLSPSPLKSTEWLISRALTASSTGAIYTGTGQCHTFDAKADGYAKAEGVGSVVLKRLSDAIRDRDPIRGVIRGWAVNSDGQTAGISTPDAVAQAACIRAAYAKAGIEDRSLTPYVEFHGTGTKASPSAPAADLLVLTVDREPCREAI